MLDRDLIEQLKTVFAALDENIHLVYQESSHEKQSELLSMLNGLAETSPKIIARSSQSSSPVPAFHLEKNGRDLGIHFRGIPGGHEFTTLVLAILNADGKGKLPDEGLRQRIRSLKGPVRIKTYISLKIGRAHV